MSDEDATSSSPGPAADDDAATWDAVVHFLERIGVRAAEAGGPAMRRIDTHAAVVVLAGRLAYKVKRPVAFPFLDFSTLAAREAACRREIAVDRPIAPEIYRRVVAITRAADGGLEIGGSGEPIEWAVEMNRFDETATLDRMLAKGPLVAGFVDDLAGAVARAETRARRRAAEPWIADLAAYLEQNAEAFAARPDLFPSAAAEAVTARSRARLSELADLLAARGRLGLVRLGHGDLHSGNIVVIDGRPRLFDAVEFDDGVATGDVLYDAGFLIMDLVDRGDRAAACRFLARWLIETVRLEAGTPIPGGLPRPGDVGDLLLEFVDGLAALPLFQSIRAALRAKIAAARADHLPPAARETAEAEARRLFAAAKAHLEPAAPRLVAIGGLSGSGKSSLAFSLAPRFDPAPGALVLRSDEIRKLLAGVVPATRLAPSAYGAKSSERVYAVMERAASRALAAGMSVIVDAVAARAEERRRLEALAESCEVPFAGLWLDVDEATALTRIGERSGDASDADAAVVALQRGFDVGDVAWPRIDANGAAEATLAGALATLAG